MTIHAFCSYCLFLYQTRCGWSAASRNERVCVSGPGPNGKQDGEDEIGDIEKSKERERHCHSRVRLVLIKGTRILARPTRPEILHPLGQRLRIAGDLAHERHAHGHHVHDAQHAGNVRFAQHGGERIGDAEGSTDESEAGEGNAPAENHIVPDNLIGDKGGDPQVA